MATSSPSTTHIELVKKRTMQRTRNSSARSGDNRGQPQPVGHLSGRTAWIITDGKAGMVVQARGVADALGVDYEMKTVAPSAVFNALAPWGPVNPAERFGKPGAAFAPPWPDIAIATGRAAIPYIRALKSKAGDKTFTVVLQDPKSGPGTADMIWVPAHDKRRGPNVMTTPTSPHSFSHARLTDLRANLPAAIRDLPKPRITVVLGGKNGVYKFTEDDDDRFCRSLQSLAALGASFLITPSRRTHKRLIAAADRATANAPRILWDGEGDNPYPDFLAAADALVVTADSVNMCGEACATGKPVYIFTPSGGSAKFSRFHEELSAHGATRPLPEKFQQLETWSYDPIHSAQAIAAEIAARMKSQSAD